MSDWIHDLGVAINKAMDSLTAETLEPCEKCEVYAVLRFEDFTGKSLCDECLKRLAVRSFRRLGPGEPL